MSFGEKMKWGREKRENLKEKERMRKDKGKKLIRRVK
jgi:hypothetical protein